MDYGKDIKIDDTALDVEWLNQPALAIKWGVYWANCTMKVQQAEENVKLVRSELIEKVTGDPEKYLEEDVKPTAPIVEAYYRNHKEHKKAKKDLVKAQFELNVAIITKGEFSSGRKEALKNLVILHGQNYFAGPSVPRDLTKEASKQEIQKTSNKKIKIRKPKN